MSTETAAPAPIRVFVVEDDPARRDDFRATVAGAPGLALAGVAATLSEALAALRRSGPPDVLLVDLGLPDGDGTQLIRELRDVFPQVSVLVVTMFSDEAHVLRALEAGAHGYLLKDSDGPEVERAIRQVHDGDAPLAPRIARHLLRRFGNGNGAPASPGERLSPREVDILSRIAQGHTGREVADQLGLSAHTVATHVRNIYDKLRVGNRVQAVNRARATGQIP